MAFSKTYTTHSVREPKPQEPVVDAAVEETATVAAEEAAPKAPRKPVEVRRFCLPDIEPFGAWMVARLRERWSYLTDRTMVSFVRGAMDSNQYFFVRTDDAIGMAILDHEPMTATPFAREVFVLMRDVEDSQQAREVMAIYAQMRNWAKAQSCDRLEVENFTDASRELIKAATGNRVMIKESSFVKVV